jgi:hypothetical protein
MSDVCGRTTSELWAVTNQQCKKPYLYLALPSTARLLSWTETGPTAVGESTAEQTVLVPPAANYVCAYVALAKSPSRLTGERDRPEQTSPWSISPICPSLKPDSQ